MKQRAINYLEDFMKRSTHLILGVLCAGVLSAGPAFGDQGSKDKGGNHGQAHDVQKHKDKDKDKDDKDRRGDHGRNDRDRDRTDDRNRDRDNGRSDGSTMRFHGLDTNHDGRISRAEWRGNDTSFANHDWNRDGVLSGDEVREGATRPSTRRR